MYGKAIVSALLLSSLVLPIRGQQPQSAPRPSPSPTQPNPPRDEDQDVVRITTNLVQVDVVVTKDGKQVTDLKPEDFELFEDGKPQTITHFAYVSNVPLAAPTKAAAPAPNKKEPAAPVIPITPRPNEARRTIAFLVDDLGMSSESTNQARRQLRKYVDEQLQPNDLVAIIRTSAEIGSLQQFTTDKRLLHSAIEHLKWNLCSRTGPYVFSPAGRPNDTPICGDINNQVSVRNSLHAFRFVLEGMRSLPGRKSVVIFSDNLPIQQQEPGPLSLGSNRDVIGNDSATRKSNFASDDVISYAGLLQKVAEVAIRSSVVIYAVDTRGLQYTGVTAADRLSGSVQQITNQIQTITTNRSLALLSGREGADLIARQTGGFLIRNSNDFGIHRVMDDQRGYYLLGYRPGDQTFNRRFHHLRARVKQHGLIVRTREGFFGVTEDDARRIQLAPHDQMIAALMSPFGASDISVRLTAFFTNEATTGDLLRSFLYVEPNGLTFAEEPDGTHKARLDFSGIVFGDNGRVILRRDLSGELHLDKQLYEQAMRDGIVYGFDMPIKQSGAFQVRVAVRDAASSRIGAAGEFVEVPSLRSGRLALSGIVVRNEASLGPPITDQSANPEERDVVNGPAVRRFPQGSTLMFVFKIYNATVDKATHLPQLTAQTRIFREGKAIFSGNEIPVDAAGQPDLQRIAGFSRFQLGTQLPPGEYVLQIIVSDQLSKEKKHVATQSIDFEVVK